MACTGQTADIHDSEISSFLFFFFFFLFSCKKSKCSKDLYLPQFYQTFITYISIPKVLAPLSNCDFEWRSRSFYTVECIGNYKHTSYDNNPFVYTLAQSNSSAIVCFFFLFLPSVFFVFFLGGGGGGERVRGALLLLLDEATKKWLST